MKLQVRLTYCSTRTQQDKTKQNDSQLLIDITHSTICHVYWRRHDHSTSIFHHTHLNNTLFKQNLHELFHFST